MLTLEELANLGEFISGIAVIASLIYLAAQIRQNTKTVKSSTLIGNTEIFSNIFLKVSDKDHISAYNYGSSGREDIRPTEFSQFILQARVLFLGFENQYYQFINGSFDEATYKGYERAISEQLLSFRGFRMYWQMCKHLFSPVFATHVDELIANTPEQKLDFMLVEWQRLAREFEEADKLSK